MDGWIKMFEIDGDEKVAAVKYVNRRNIVTINEEGGRIAAVMSNGDTVGMPEMPPGEAKLPYDAEVEYLESTGTQYVNSGINSSSVVGIEVDCSGVPTNAWICGGRRALAVSALGFYRVPNGNLRVCYGAQQTEHPFGAARHVLALRDASYFADGALVYSFPPETFDSDQPIYLLNLNTGGGQPSNIGMVGDMYWARIYSDGVLVRDFIPVRVGGGSSAVGYLYDRANPDGGPLGNGLYGNAADGQGGKAGFPANCIGPDKPKS